MSNESNPANNKTKPGQLRQDSVPVKSVAAINKDISNIFQTKKSPKFKNSEHTTTH